MNVVRVKKGDLVARRQEKVMEWYLIQLGSVIRQYNFAEITLGANTIIGILENEWFTCDYIAREDTTLIVIPCKNADNLRALLKNQANFRPVFLRTAVEQRHQALCLYASLKKRASLLHMTAQTTYNDYKNLCSTFMVPERSFYRLANFEPLKIQHKAENWEISNSVSLMQGYLREYLQLMIKDDSLCVGAIMEASAQMHRTAQGIEEIANYLTYNRDILWNDSEDDIFHLYFHLAVQLAESGRDTEKCQAGMKAVCAAMKQLGIYEPAQIDECANACSNYQLKPESGKQINIIGEDCVAHIMSYGGYDKDEIRKFKELLQSYKNLPDRLSSDKDVRSLRKAIATKFYEIYAKAFFNSMTDGQISPVMQMFFNFGFMDVELLGESQTIALLRFSESIGLFHNTHIYTIYEWLKGIYAGKREPSRNEFDLDYNGSLQEQLKQGDITDREMAALKKDQRAKVEFEIFNLFKTTHKTSTGRITTFCPILSEDDLMHSYEKMAVTAARMEQSINNIRQLDYSVLYREVMFSDPDRGINQEWIMKEVMPDVILLPCVGTRATMWQETAGTRTDTPARFVFPIFISSDLDEQMVLTMGRYRWEICRKIQGNYWNDFREKSLTSEFYDYVQFYKKNKELSPETKEKLKSEITHARNNIREVFVQDYVNWLKYESQGSFRLNKVSRDILTRYCPFSREVRMSLTSNPLYQNAFNKLDINNEKKVARLNALYTKYEAAGGKITPDLNENLKFYQM